MFGIDHISTASLEKLYNMINNTRKSSITGDDILQYAEKRKLNDVIQKFSHEKVEPYYDEIDSVINIASFKAGYIKEIERFYNEMIVFKERKDLEDGLYHELEREAGEEQTFEYNEDGLMLGAKIYIAIIETKNLRFKKNPNFIVSAVITCGNIQLTTEPVLCNGGMAIWLDERFSLPIFTGDETVNISLFEEDQETEKNFIAASEINVQTLKDFRIHKRTYPLFDDQGAFCGELVTKLLYIFDQPAYNAEKIARKKAAYKTTSARSEYLLKLLAEKIYHLQNNEGDELFEEIFGREVELPSSLLLKTQENEKEPPEGEVDFLSESPSIYEEENMINFFINNIDEEKIFEKYFERENQHDILDDEHERITGVPVSDDNVSKREKIVSQRRNIGSLGRPPVAGTHRKLTEDLELSGFQNEFNNNGLSFSEIDSTRNFFLDATKNKNFKSTGSGHHLNISNILFTERSNLFTAGSTKAEGSAWDTKFRSSARIKEIATQESQTQKKITNDLPKNTQKPIEPKKKENFNEKAVLHGITLMLKLKKQHF